MRRSDGFAKVPAFRVICKSTVGLIISFALVAWSQQRVVTVVPAKPSLPVHRLEKGLVEGKTYKNPSLGFELTPAPELQFDNPELNGTPGTVPLVVTVAAWGEKKLFSTRDGTTFYADALAYYPDDQRSTGAYTRKVIQANRDEGFEPVGSLEGIFGGLSFARTDFKRGAVYEAVLVKACDAQALIFIFTGSGRDRVNKLIAATELKLDSVRSGCRPRAAGARKKRTVRQ